MAIGDVFRVVERVVVDVIKGARDALKALWDVVGGLLGCVIGSAAYWYASGWVHSFGGGKDRRRLSSDEKEFLSAVFGDRLNVDNIWLHTDVNLSGIPGNPGGLTLGYSIYLKRKDVAMCDVSDMALLAHEATHVLQYKELTRMGFACLYGGLIAADFNANNALEKAAYAVEDSIGEDTLLPWCAGKTPTPPAMPRASSDWFWVSWG